MKKVFLWLFLIIMFLLCIKSGLGLGKKDTIIDVINYDSTQQKNNVDDKKDENILANNPNNDYKNQDSYYTSIDPIEVTSYIFNEKLINSSIILLNENSFFENEEFLELKNNFDFDKNTYILINCTSKENINCISKELTKSKLSFIINYNNNENSNNTLLLEIKNIKVNKISCFDLEWSE